MTKQPHSATKLRLSKLFRWLAVLCFMKLTILGLLLLDVPAPSWLGGSPKQEASKQDNSRQDAPARAESDQRGVQQMAAAPAPTVSGQVSDQLSGQISGLAHSLGSTLTSLGSDLDSAVTSIKDKAETSLSEPQGAAAARMAAAAKPQTGHTAVADAGTHFEEVHRQRASTPLEPQHFGQVGAEFIRCEALAHAALLIKDKRLAAAVFRHAKAGHAHTVSVHGGKVTVELL